jgi:hypothetical protein
MSNVGKCCIIPLHHGIECLTCPSNSAFSPETLRRSNFQLEASSAIPSWCLRIPFQVSIRATLSPTIFMPLDAILIRAFQTFWFSCPSELNAYVWLSMIKFAQRTPLPTEFTLKIHRDKWQNHLQLPCEEYRRTFFDGWDVENLEFVRLTSPLAFIVFIVLPEKDQSSFIRPSNLQHLSHVLHIGSVDQQFSPSRKSLKGHRKWTQIFRIYFGSFDVRSFHVATVWTKLPISLDGLPGQPEVVIVRSGSIHLAHQRTLS